MGALVHGHAITITYGSAPSGGFLFYPIEFTLPGIDGGEPIDVTRLANTLYMTKKPPKLIEIMQARMVVQYDPEVIDQVTAKINVNQQITVAIPGNGSAVMFGWIRSFSPGPFRDRVLATAEVVHEISNLNTSDVETGPVRNP